jgi:hypothetical protein
MYSKVRIGKYLSDISLIRNGIKQGDALSPLLINFALNHAIRKVQKNQVGLMLKGTHQVLVYADDVNLLGDNKSTKKKNTEHLANVSKEICLEINVEKTKYMLLSFHQNACQNPKMKIGNRSFENVSRFEYLGPTVTKQTLVQEQLKRKLHSGNVCCNSVHKLCLSFCTVKTQKFEYIRLQFCLWFCMVVKFGL